MQRFQIWIAGPLGLIRARRIVRQGNLGLEFMCSEVSEATACAFEALRLKLAPFCRRNRATRVFDAGWTVSSETFLVQNMSAGRNRVSPVDELTKGLHSGSRMRLEIHFA